jgi:hypothetical protein
LITSCLILAYANGFRVNFNQFSQWIWKSSPNRNRTTNGNIIIRKLLLNFRCWINGGSRLWNYKYLNSFIKSIFLIKLSFLEAVPLPIEIASFYANSPSNGFFSSPSPLLLGHVEINGLVVHKSFFVKTNNFTDLKPGSIAKIRFLPKVALATIVLNY